MSYYEMRTELQHDGIKNMKWGIRRYQNYDGTLTEEGKKRYSKYYNAGNANKNIVQEKMRKDAWEADKEDIKLMKNAALKAGKDGKPSQLEKMTNNARDIANESRNIGKNLKPRTQKGPSEKAKSMSNEELSKAIKRMELERRYDSLNAKDIESGYDKTMRILEISGSAVAIAGGLAGIATAYATISEARRKD